MSSAHNLDTAFTALAHPARRAMVARLAEGAATIKELAEPLDMSLPAVSKHIRVLETAGLITLRKEAQFKRCTLQTEPLRAVADWTAQYRPIWEARFDEMDALLNRMKGDTDE